MLDTALKDLLTQNRPLTIGIDADGVLLHYNLSYGKVWAKAFGATPVIQEENAYHAQTFWGVETPPSGHKFWGIFDREGWKSMDPMPGALEACLMLKEAGHRLICITSMPKHKREDRLKNLQNLGFPIDDVLAVGHSRTKDKNPKKEAIDGLCPDLFIDDELRKLKDLSCATVLIDPPDCPDSQNEGKDDSFVSLRTGSLLDFAKIFTASPATK